MKHQELYVMNIINHQTGWVEVICGSMFSGKTEELIRRVRRAEFARQKTQVFKPEIDNRYDEDHIVSHSRLMMPSENITRAADIAQLVKDDTEVVAIDEAHFLDEEIVGICNELADRGKRVIVAGLDQDYRNRPFGYMPQLLAIAEYITKTMAICMKCGNPANRTQRLIKDEKTVIVGASDIYEARCRNCHKKEV
jgi:thymidine kinase